MRTRADQLLDAFERFHRGNPKVWDLFQQFAWEAVRTGRKHFSSKAVFERIRWHTAIETTEDELKLCNNYTPHYARMFHLKHPSRDGFFKTKKLISEDVAASGDEQLRISEEPAGDEVLITSRLKAILATTAVAI